MEGEGNDGLGCALGSGRSVAVARGSGRRRRDSSHDGRGPVSGSRGARQTRELKAAAAPASSELDGALRLPWRGGFGSGIQTTSSISGGRGPAAGAARLGGVLRELRRQIEAVRGGSRHIEAYATACGRIPPSSARSDMEASEEEASVEAGGARGLSFCVHCWSWSFF